MYRRVLRDPGGSSLIRILPDICDERIAIVDGSILLVPAGTTRLFVIQWNTLTTVSSGQT